MPWKSRGPTRFTPIKKVEPVRLNVDATMAEINAVVMAVVDETARAALMVAKARVPVRKVFKGGRSSSRIMSIEELRGESLAFYRSLSTAQQKSWKLIRRATGPSGAIVSPLSSRGRIGTRIATARDRQNMWHITSESREVVMEQGTGIYHLANRALERQLNARGQYELRAASLPVGVGLTDKGGRPIPSLRQARHAVWSSTTITKGPGGYNAITTLHLGGNLRNTIGIESYDRRGSRIEDAVRAGGERAPYARFVEFGTRHSPAQPFLRPALKHVEKKYADRMEKALRMRFLRRG